MKRFLMPILVLLFAWSARAQDSGQTPETSNSLDFQVDGIYYTVVDAGQKTCITKAGYSSIDYNSRKIVTTFGNNVSGNVTIPASVVKDENPQDTYTVIGVGAYGFNGATSVTISEGIKELGIGAFIYNTELTSVVIPESITTIGTSAFAGCMSLTSVTLPRTLTAIPTSMFTSCTSLANIVMPENLVTIGENAFSHCTALQSVVLPNSVTQLGESVFYECSSLSSVTLSENLSAIPARTFTATKLQNITLPANIASIGASAFNCGSLMEVTCLSKQTPAISSNSFSSATYANGVLKVYKTALPVYEKSILWNDFVNKELIPVALTGLTLNYPSMVINVGLTGQLKATYQPEEATGEITWSVTSCSPEGAVTVDQNGLVSTSMIGSATITAACGDISASCDVTVQTNPSESVTISPIASDLYVGDAVTLSALVLPATITSPVTWSSSNPDVAAIDASNGQLTAISPGGAVITAECAGITGQLQVVVLPIVASEIALSQSEVNLKPGETALVTATIKPSNVTYPVINWETSDPNVAIVSDGTITAVGVGTATIRAICDGVTANCMVTVSPILATEITLTTTQATMKVGQTLGIGATVLPDNTTDKTIEWVSDNEKVATVSMDGTITAVGLGSATITASSGSVSAKCNITVEPTEASEVVINFSHITLRATQIQQLSATVPENTTDKTITWSSNNEAVATVTADGLVTAVSVGKAEITAACGNVSAICEVNVEATPIERIVLSVNENTLNVGESLTINADIYPETATDKTLAWISSLTEIATVDNGRVTGVAPGTVTITASAGSVSSAVTITVLQPATSVSLNMSKMTLQIGTMDDLIATVEPSNTTDAIVWTSSSDEVAVVNDHGIVSGLSIGSAVITVTCGKASATCNVSVVAVPAESVILSAEKITLKEGQAQQLTATVLPAETTYPIVSWSTSDANVATVGEDGTVTGVAAGTATITATCGDATATCEVTVEAIAPDEIVLSYAELTMKAADTMQLSATINGQENLNVTWSSSNPQVATVSSDGLVTAISVGTATITVSYGSMSATCKVTVEPTPALSIELDYTSVTLRVKETFLIQATVLPATTTDQTIVWVSDNPEVASVNEDGLVLANGIGTTTITAICGNVFATCLVTVEDEEPASVESDLIDAETVYRVYDMQGMLILFTKNKEDLEKLSNGLYIINGKKYYIKH